MSRSKSGMGGGKSTSKSKSSGAHEVHIKRAHGGGFVVKHHKKHKPGQLDQGEPEDHVISDMDQLKAHLDDHLGDQPPAGEGPAPEQAAAPAPQAPTPQMGM